MSHQSAGRLRSGDCPDVCRGCLRAGWPHRRPCGESPGTRGTVADFPWALNFFLVARSHFASSKGTQGMLFAVKPITRFAAVCVVVLVSIFLAPGRAGCVAGAAQRSCQDRRAHSRDRGAQRPSVPAKRGRVQRKRGRASPPHEARNRRFADKNRRRLHRASRYRFVGHRQALSGAILGRHSESPARSSCAVSSSGFPSRRPRAVGSEWQDERCLLAPLVFLIRRGFQCSRRRVERVRPTLEPR